MSELEFRSNFEVHLVDWMGSETKIAAVARVADPMKPVFVDLDASDKDKGLLRMLMRDRHGTPWESAVLQFYIEAPIFVNREFFRHRIASYNETSARYRVLKPEFYIPDYERPMVQAGKPGAYTFTKGDEGLAESAMLLTEESSSLSWGFYKQMLDLGIAREVARNVLPVNIYSPFYVTMNLRAFFNFLSLRRVTEATTVPTFPQYEIDQVAGMMEDQVREEFPYALELFDEFGRVAP